MRSFARISCVILSAGGSGRMGKHKALLPFGDENITFLEKIVRIYSAPDISQIVVVVNQQLYDLIETNKLYLPENVSVIVNRLPGKGRFYSLQTGLKCIVDGESVFIQNVDNPFVGKDVLELLLESRDQADVILPAFAGKTGHPVLLSPVVCKSIVSCEDPENRIDQYLKKFASVIVETNDAKILVNINNRADYDNEFYGDHLIT
jgi:molybdenum cofactor cytidylyltransferase